MNFKAFLGQRLGRKRPYYKQYTTQSRPENRELWRFLSELAIALLTRGRWSRWRSRLVDQLVVSLEARGVRR